MTRDEILLIAKRMIEERGGSQIDDEEELLRFAVVLGNRVAAELRRHQGGGGEHMSKHTPGPWVAVTRTNAYIEIEAPSQPGYSAKKVATVSLTNHEANARLIAAAPDLLEALKLAADFLEHSTEFRIGHPGFEGAQAKARAAIKAVEEGEKT